MKTLGLSALLFVPALSFLAAGFGAPWIRHTIDASSRGADGVRVGDINRDGLPDLTTGWEEGGLVRVYLNPGPLHAKEPWPAVTVGKVTSPEDAVFADVDGDGRLDVVSCCEGGTRTVFVHWSPAEESSLLAPEAWRTEFIPATAGKEMWMFSLPMDVDGRNGQDLVIGSKGAPNASISWLEGPDDPRDLSSWNLHRIYDAGWIMSLIAQDMDKDGDVDIVASDRRPPKSGILWLENPGKAAAIHGARWEEHRIGAEGEEVMFIDLRVMEHSQSTLWAAVVPRRMNHFEPKLSARGSWPSQTYDLEIPVGTAKAIRSVDINQDGRTDLVYSCEHATGARSGVFWLDREDQGGPWLPHEISGPEGVKFDRIELLDLDADGDLDVITCEEVENLGVIWYENPTR